MLNQETRRISKDENGWHINNSSLDIIQQCGRKAHYIFSKPETETKGIALAFGSCIHAGLRVFYEATDRNDDLLPRMVDAFKSLATPEMLALDPKEKRSILCGEKILKQFYETYKADEWELYSDDQGPFVERMVEAKIGEKLFFFGTIDVVLKNKISGDLCVVDHKTSTSLGKEFSQKGDLSHQLIGYIFACQQMGMKVTRAMFQGLQVAKTMNNVLRVFTNVSEEQIVEWKEWVYHQVTVWEMMNKTGNFPQNGSHPCISFGGCQYLPVCAAPKQFREQLLADINKKTEEAEE